MLQYIEFLARFFTAAFELSAADHTLWELALVAAIGLAGTAVVVTARTSFAPAVTAGTPRTSSILPPRDTSRMLAQSAPDAAGKPRPRAPGLVTATVA
ncbi:DUF6412 domain-containing protein [Microbacterium sp. MPKO10]|uniref:DUF6412 domain-containing protein n=1 Tax=Microbacterium sp. MPKO10 TaxID=2989818 RepID=UPI002236608F|nr:DUF6412 domain-containing protein [Microbacterium sp. MPKO10]MCW4457063.1 DUF6412 domain-containing protein [Microbacterium sp. MPKO10]